MECFQPPSPPPQSLCPFAIPPQPTEIAAALLSFTTGELSWPGVLQKLLPLCLGLASPLLCTASENHSHCQQQRMPVPVELCPLHLCSTYPLSQGKTFGLYPVLHNMNKPLWMFSDKPLYRHMFSFLLDTYLREELLGQMLTLCSTFWGIVRLFPNWPNQITFPPAVCESLVSPHFL